MTYSLPSETLDYERHVDGLRRSNSELRLALRNLYDACEHWEDQNDPVLVKARIAIADTPEIAAVSATPKTITVHVEGGRVQDVTGIPAGCKVRVEDRDDDGDTSHPSWDPEKKCFVTVYGGDGV